MELVARCRAAGVLRPGFAVSGIPAIFLMLGTIGDFAGGQAPPLWEPLGAADRRASIPRSGR